MPTDQPVRVRFAPSPTGYLHVGGARTALFNWLLARKSGGCFILRIEDTDQKRSVADSLAKILDDLRWLGLNWDEGPDVGGEFGPYFQSQRLEIYNPYFDRLLSAGTAYYALESPEELQAQRDRARAEKRSYIYQRPDPVPTAEDAKRARAEGRQVVVRLRVPERDFGFFDEILGPIVVNHREVEDFIIRKSDGWPTYHFACVVDDAAMKISHVLRGQEHLPNTAKHIAIQLALGFPTQDFPEGAPISRDELTQDNLRWGHLPIIMNSDGTKMSKRDKHSAVRAKVKVFVDNHDWSLQDIAYQAGCDPAVAQEWLTGADGQFEPWQLREVANQAGVEIPEIEVDDCRAIGYLPEALVNFIALLGWSPGGDREQMSVEEMTELFSVERIGRAAAKFDREKLLAFNTDWLKRVDEPRRLEALRDYAELNGSPMGGADDETLRAVLSACEGVRTFAQLEQKAGFLFVHDDAVQYDEKAVKKVLLKNEGAGLAILRDLLPLLEALEDWTPTGIEKLLRAVSEEKQIGLGKIAQPLRVAVSGGTISPSMFETLALLGRDKTLTRIRRCLDLERS